MEIRVYVNVGGHHNLFNRWGGFGTYASFVSFGEAEAALQHYKTAAETVAAVSLQVSTLPSRYVPVNLTQQGGEEALFSGAELTIVAKTIERLKVLYDAAIGNIVDKAV